MGTQVASSQHLVITSSLSSVFSRLGFSRQRRKIKMMQSLIFVLLAVAGSQAEKLTSTGVDLEPIFAFLDDDGDNLVDMTELKALTVTGEATAAEFQAAWELIAVDFGVPAEKHAKYFKLVDGVDGSEEDGVITEPENVALFGKFDVDGTPGISLDEFFNTISGVIN